MSSEQNTDKQPESPTIRFRVGDSEINLRRSDFYVRDHPPTLGDRLEIRAEVDGQETSLSFPFDDFVHLFGGMIASLDRIGWKSPQRYRTCSELSLALADAAKVGAESAEVRGQILDACDAELGPMASATLILSESPIPAMSAAEDSAFVVYDPVIGRKVTLSSQEEALDYIDQLTDRMVTTSSQPRDIRLRVVPADDFRASTEEDVAEYIQKTGSVTYADFAGAKTPGEA